MGKTKTENNFGFCFVQFDIYYLYNKKQITNAQEYL